MMLKNDSHVWYINTKIKSGFIFPLDWLLSVDSKSIAIRNSAKDKGYVDKSHLSMRTKTPTIFQNNLNLLNDFLFLKLRTKCDVATLSQGLDTLAIELNLKK
uniref:Uncharacterized protein n=1 Tax=Strigamia maritima TaxID=126957 RepID=T1J1D0_STRMM